MTQTEAAWRMRAENAVADWAAALRICAGLICRPMPPDCAQDLHRAMARAERLRLAVQDVVAQHRPADPAAPQPVPDAVYVQRLQAVLHLALRLPSVLRAVASDAPQPLYPEPPLGLAVETGAAADRLFWALHGVINPVPQDQAGVEMGAIADIPLKMSLFLQHIHAARRIALAQGKPEARFLDLGCGGGMKVLAAADAFAQADGLDHDPGYVASARAVMSRAGNRTSRILLADGLTYDGYVGYDVIYLFQPMTQGGRLAELERRVVAQVRPGTLIIAPYPWFGDHHQAYGCARIAGAVYGVGIEEPFGLATRACAMGTALRQPLTGQDYWIGPLMPVIRALRAVGYDLT